ncbi:hypothetical protein MKY04_12720 [Lysinibacillus telephonicus]
MSKSLHERLDEIWLNALKKSPCKCGNDANWNQDIKGFIRCTKCKQVVVD